MVDTDKSLELVIDILDNLGISAQDDEGNYRGINEVIIDLACAWDKVDDNNKINIFTTILKLFPVYTNKIGTDIGNAFKSVFEKLKTI